MFSRNDEFHKFNTAIIRIRHSWNLFLIAFNLDSISPVLHEKAEQAIREKDFLAFLCLTGNERAVQLVFDNIEPLKYAGELEATLIFAYAAHRLCNAHQLDKIQAIVDQCDREKLMHSGDDMPEVTQLYRGCTSSGGLHLSWTSSLETAKFFATRYGSDYGFILCCSFEADSILFYTNERNENEYVFANNPEFEIYQCIKCNESDLI